MSNNEIMKIGLIRTNHHYPNNLFIMCSLRHTCKQYSSEYKKCTLFKLLDKYTCMHILEYKVLRDLCSCGLLKRFNWFLANVSCYANVFPPMPYTPIVYPMA